MTNKRFKTLFSLLIAVVFTLVQLAPIPPAWALESSFVQEVKVSPQFQLELPPDLGTVETLTPGKGPTLLHLQTVHGNYEAQKKIEAILYYLKETYGVKLLLLEGAASKLNPELLRLFPERMDLTAKILDRLTEDALVQGPELFLVGSPDAEAYGIEKIEAYRDTRKAFKAVLASEEKIEQFLRDADQQIERLTSPYLSKELRLYLKQLEAFESKWLPFASWLAYLQREAKRELEIDLSDPTHQLDWPMLVRIFKLQEFEKKFDLKSFEKERKQFLKAIKGFQAYREIETLLTSPLTRHALPDPETGLLFEKMVSHLPAHFNYQAYPNVLLFIGHLILQSELKASRLGEEIERLTDEIAQRLAKSDEEKKILLLLKDHRLLKRLFALELTPKDFEEISKRFEVLRPEALIARFQTLNTSKRVRDVTFAPTREVDLLFERALEFYRGVKERDRWMMENVLERLRETGAQKAVVVTGGFHAEPFKDFFEKAGFNYALITPKITSLEGREAYVRSILQNEPTLFARSTMAGVPLPEDVGVRVALEDKPVWIARELAGLIAEVVLPEKAANLKGSAVELNGVEKGRLVVRFLPGALVPEEKEFRVPAKLAYRGAVEPVREGQSRSEVRSHLGDYMRLDPGLSWSAWFATMLFGYQWGKVNGALRRFDRETRQSLLSQIKTIVNFLVKHEDRKDRKSAKWFLRHTAPRFLQDAEAVRLLLEDIEETFSLTYAALNEQRSLGFPINPSKALWRTKHALSTKEALRPVRQSWGETGEKIIGLTAIRFEVEPQDLTPETKFNDFKVLGSQDVDYVELVMDWEAEFGITIPDEAAGKFETVLQAMNYIAEREAIGRRSEVRSRTAFQDLGGLRGAKWWNAMEPERQRALIQFLGEEGTRPVNTIPVDHHKPKSHYGHVLGPDENDATPNMLLVIKNMASYVEKFLIHPGYLLGRIEHGSGNFVNLFELSKRLPEKVRREFGEIVLHPELPQEKSYILKWEGNGTPNGTEIGVIGERPTNQGEELGITPEDVAKIPQVIGLKFMVYVDSSQKQTLETIVSEVKKQSQAAHQAGLLFFPEDLPAKTVSGRNYEEVFALDTLEGQVAFASWVANNPLEFVSVLARHGVDYDAYKFTFPGDLRSFGRNWVMPGQVIDVNLLWLNGKTDGRFVMMLSGGDTETLLDKVTLSRDALPFVGNFAGRGVWRKSFTDVPPAANGDPEALRQATEAIAHNLREGDARKQFEALESIRLRQPWWEYLDLTREQALQALRSEARREKDGIVGFSHNGIRVEYESMNVKRLPDLGSALREILNRGGDPETIWKQFEEFKSEQVTVRGRSFTLSIIGKSTGILLGAHRNVSFKFSEQGITVALGKIAFPPTPAQLATENILAAIRKGELGKAAEFLTLHHHEIAPNHLSELAGKIRDVYRGPIKIVGKVGGTTISFEASTPDGLLGFRVTVPTNRKGDNEPAVVKRIADVITEVAHFYDSKVHLNSVYFTAPGFFDLEGKLTEPEANIPGLNRVGFSFQESVQRELASRFSREIPVTVDHDGTGAARGEVSKFGTLAGIPEEEQDFLFVIVGTGIGTRRFWKGKPFFGDERVRYLINEMPHTLLFTGDPSKPDYQNVGLLTQGGPHYTNRFLADGVNPNPEYRGPDLEDRTSGPGIAQYTQSEVTRILQEPGSPEFNAARELLLRVEHKIGKIDAKLIGTLANEGNSIAKRIVEERGRELGIGLAVLIMEYDRVFRVPPPKHGVILGSGVAQIGEIFLNAVRDGATERFRQAGVDYPRENFILSRIKDDTARELLGGLSSPGAPASPAGRRSEVRNEEPVPQADEGLKAVEESFEITAEKMKEAATNFQLEMKRGISGEPSSLKMINSFVPKPAGNETGEFLALDLGGTKFRVLFVRLQDGRIEYRAIHTFKLPRRLIRSNQEEFFGFVADRIRHVASKEGLSPEKTYPLGFTFAFPVKQTSINQGRLIHWDKDFSVRGVKGKEVVGLLEKALIKIDIRNVEVAVLVNDTVGTLATEKGASIGAILGTGTNGAFWGESFAYNTEWGGFNHFPDGVITPYDRELDAQSTNPGQQIFEKMVSGKYLGEIARLILKDLQTHRGLFQRRHFELLSEPGRLKTEDLTAILDDSSDHHIVVKALFPGINDEEKEIVRRVADLVLTRSAKLFVAVVFAILSEIDPELAREHMVAIDGSLYEDQEYSYRVQKATEELLQEKWARVGYRLTKDGSGTGAAIIAAIATSARSEAREPKEVPLEVEDAIRFLENHSKAGAASVKDPNSLMAGVLRAANSWAGFASNSPIMKVADKVERGDLLTKRDQTDLRLALQMLILHWEARTGKKRSEVRNLADEPMTRRESIRGLIGFFAGSMLAGVAAQEVKTQQPPAQEKELEALGKLTPKELLMRLSAKPELESTKENFRLMIKWLKQKEPTESELLDRFLKYLDKAVELKDKILTEFYPGLKTLGETDDQKVIVHLSPVAFSNLIKDLQTVGSGDLFLLVLMSVVKREAFGAFMLEQNREDILKTQQRASEAEKEFEKLGKGSTFGEVVALFRKHEDSLKDNMAVVTAGETYEILVQLDFIRWMQKGIYEPANVEKLLKGEQGELIQKIIRTSSIMPLQVGGKEQKPLIRYYLLNFLATGSVDLLVNTKLDGPYINYGLSVLSEILKYQETEGKKGIDPSKLKDLSLEWIKTEEGFKSLTETLKPLVDDLADRVEKKLQEFKAKVEKAGRSEARTTRGGEVQREALKSLATELIKAIEATVPAAKAHYTTAESHRVQQKVAEAWGGALSQMSLLEVRAFPAVSEALSQPLLAAVAKKSFDQIVQAMTTSVSEMRAFEEVRGMGKGVFNGVYQGLVYQIIAAIPQLTVPSKQDRDLKRVNELLKVFDNVRAQIFRNKLRLVPLEDDRFLQRLFRGAGVEITPQRLEPAFRAIWDARQEKTQLKEEVHGLPRSELRERESKQTTVLGFNTLERRAAFESSLPASVLLTKKVLRFRFSEFLEGLRASGLLQEITEPFGIQLAYVAPGVLSLESVVETEAGEAAVRVAATPNLTLAEAGRVLYRTDRLKELTGDAEALFNLLQTLSRLREDGLVENLVAFEGNKREILQKIGRVLSSKNRLTSLERNTEVKALLAHLERGELIDFVGRRGVENYLRVNGSRWGVSIFRTSLDPKLAQDLPGVADFVLEKGKIPARDRSIGLPFVTFGLLRVSKLIQGLKRSEQRQALQISLRDSIFPGAVVKFDGRSWRLESLKAYLSTLFRNRRVVAIAA